MIEAVKTTASPGEIWAIVVVVVPALALWLAAVAWADMHPDVRHRQLPQMRGPVLGGIHRAEGGRSVAPTRDAAAVPEVPAQRTGEADRPEHAPAGAGSADQPGGG